MADLTRKDLHQTSTGVGHHYTPGYYFPSTNFKGGGQVDHTQITSRAEMAASAATVPVTPPGVHCHAYFIVREMVKCLNLKPNKTVIGEPLPPTLAARDDVPKLERFKTTTGSAHDLKHLGGVYGNNDPVYKKAPGHWKVNYVKNLHEKLGSGGFRRPLTMGNQTSETHGEFRSQPGLSMGGEFTPNPQGFNLNNHHIEGPSKKMVPSTQNAKLQGRPFFVKDRGARNLNDMYLTSTNKEHRAFKPNELESYPKKDVPTYWECEEYPKAWGHGLLHNPLPKDTVPRERLPMRDPTWFKSETKVRRLPNAMVPVPHSGLAPLQKESYMKPSDVKMKEIFYCPVDTPFTLPQPGPKSAFTAPQMYKTEYKNVGSGKQITV